MAHAGKARFRGRVPGQLVVGLLSERIWRRTGSGPQFRWADVCRGQCGWVRRGL